MTQPVYKKKDRSASPKTVALREEFVALTHDPLVAIVLNQLLYWTQRVKDFDLLLAEEQFYNPDCHAAPRHGWIYKTAKELTEETMICVDRTTMRRYLKELIDHGWLEERSNPHNKWDKTSQYRLNLRNLQNDLFLLGFKLPGIEALRREYSAPSNVNPSNEQISPSNDFEDQDDPSEEEDSTPKEKTAPSERSNSPFLSTENTTEIKNREDDRETRARENFCALENSVSENSASENSVAEEMVSLWESHVVQKLDPTNWQDVIHLTEERKEQLNSLFAFYFKNNIRLWELFCLRVKNSAFLMGKNPREWKVTFDWVLTEANLLKVLEGNYDDAKVQEPCDWKLEPIQSNPIRDAEKAAIVASIKDPVWRGWCSQLAEGVRLNDLKMLHEPLSTADLQQIANARFLECEDKRLVWVGSSDQSALNRIDDLRLKISWVFAKEYPKASTFRTRLDDSYSLNPSNEGEIHA